MLQPLTGSDPAFVLTITERITVPRGGREVVARLRAFGASTGQSLRTVCNGKLKDQPLAGWPFM
jgi:hypothetical protein